MLNSLQVSTELKFFGKNLLNLAINIKQLTVMPFGTINAPATFTHMMRELLKLLNNPAISNFMDDILTVKPTSCCFDHRNVPMTVCH